MPRAPSSKPQRDAVVQAVKQTAWRLFAQHGFAATTIRDISAASGVSSGSIYHFFLDKEGLFKELVLDAFAHTHLFADEVAPAQRDPFMHLAARWGYLVHWMSVDARAAELFRVAYRSTAIHTALLLAATERHQQVLAHRAAATDPMDCYIATLMLGGALAALVDDRLDVGRLNEEQRVRTVLTFVLPHLGATPSEVERVVRQLGQLRPRMATPDLSLPP